MLSFCRETLHSLPSLTLPLAVELVLNQLSVSITFTKSTYCPTKTLIVIVLYLWSAVPTDVLPLNTSTLTFDVGDTQECASIQVVDDDLLEDTESFFVSIFSFSFVTTVQANRSSANVIISDNEGTNNDLMCDMYIPLESGRL